MQLYKTRQGIFLQHNQHQYLLHDDWDTLINRNDLHAHLRELITGVVRPQDELTPFAENLMAPIGSQELWAAGVTYLRSRDARMDESRDSGGADFYQKVYEADRPELFFKALPHRISAHLEPVNIRKDSHWNVPEPELTLFINSQGSIQGYTIGNDMSSRDIEGENPLYLPQAKVYERSAALGPCLYVPEKPISPETVISIQIIRGEQIIFSDSIALSRMKRAFTELASWLYRECKFSRGCYLMTGTGMVPPPDFTLHSGDRVEISIEPIGTLINTVDSGW